MKNKLFTLLFSIAVASSAIESQSLSWVTQFDDLTLTKIVNHGIDNNRNLQASQKRTEQVFQQAKLNRSLLFPNLYAKGRWNGGDLNGTSQPGTTDTDMMKTAAVSLDARYNVSSLGEEMQQYKAVLNNYKAQMQDHKDAQLRTSIQVIKLYFDAIYTGSQVKILEKQKQTAETLLQLTQKRYNLGQSSGLALLQQKQQVASIKASIPPAKLQHSNSMQFLSATTFLSVDSLQALLPDTLPFLHKDIDSTVTIEKRPDLVAVALREESAKASFAKAKLTLIPDLSISGSAGWDYGDPGTAEWEKMWNIGATISVPIFTGGAVVAGYKEGRDGYEAAVALKEQAWADAQAQLTNSLTEEHSYREQVSAYNAQLEASQAVYDESIRQYRNGIVQYIEVLTSINALQQTEIIQLQSTRNLLHARLNIIQSIGGYMPSKTN